MLFTSLAAAAAQVQPLMFALQSHGSNEAAYRVILGLGIIAAVEIAAGLLMIRAGSHSHRGDRR